MSPQRLRHLVILAVISSSVGCDQATKVLAIDKLKGQAPMEWGPARLAYAENPGAFLGMGGEWPPAVRQAVFLIMAGLIVVGGTVWLFRAKRSWPMVLGGAMFVGGALGNLIDRAFREGGRVVDFAQIDFGIVSTGVFNWADVLLMAAIPIFLIWGREDEDADADADAGSPPEPTAAPA